MQYPNKIFCSQIEGMASQLKFKIMIVGLAVHPSLSVMIRRRKWVGHTLRKGEQNIARHSLEWHPQGIHSVDQPTKQKLVRWRSFVAILFENTTYLRFVCRSYV